MRAAGALKGRAADMGISHSAFLRFKPDASEEALQALWDKLDEFPANKPGIRRWISGKPGPYYPSASDYYQFGFTCELDSATVMPAFHGHPFHAQAGALMGPVVDDYIVLNYEFTAVQQSAVVHKPPREGDPAVAVAHVVMLKFKEEVSDETLEEFRLALDLFPREKSYIRRWTVGKTVQLYPGATDRFDLAFIAEVDSIEAMEEYAAHPFHTEIVGPMLVPIMEDVLVVDYTYSRVLQSATDYAQIIPG
jgi:hypothetical protein